MSDGENESDIIDRDVDDVLAVPLHATTPDGKGQSIDRSSKRSSEKPHEVSSPSSQQNQQVPSDGSHTIDGITQIDIIGRRHIRIHHHGTVAVGTVCSINDLILDDTATSSHIPVNGLDLLQLLACQPIHALDVQPLTDEIDEIIDQSNVFPAQYSIHFLAVPDGALGVEVSHLSLQQALNILPGGSMNNTSFLQGSGFRIDRYLYSKPQDTEFPIALPLFSVGDIIIAVNDTSIISMPAPTAAAILAQTKNRRFTLLRITKRPEDAQAQSYLKTREFTPEGRKRYRSFLREDTYQKYGQSHPRRVNMEDKAVETEKQQDQPGDLIHSTTTDIERIIRRETEEILEDHTDITTTNEPLHKRWCAMRRTFLCHTLYKPVSDLYPAALRQETNLNTPTVSYNSNADKDYAEAWRRQKFLEVIYAKEGSRDLKNTLMRKFRRLEN